MFLEQGFGSLHAFVRQQHGFGLAPGIVNVAALMQSIQNIPTVTFPGSESPVVLERGQIQQCKRNLIDLVFINLHQDLLRPLIRPVTVCNPIWHGTGGR